MEPRTYKIGEAATLLNLKTYVLRFWETEFPQITPLRTDKGQRLYTEENLIFLRKVQYLLHEQGLTIDGARRIISDEAALHALDGAVVAGEEFSTLLHEKPALEERPRESSWVPTEAIRPSSSFASETEQSLDQRHLMVDTLFYQELITDLEEVVAALRGQRLS